MRKTKIFFSLISIFAILLSSFQSAFAAENTDSNEINAYLDKIKGTVLISNKIYRARNNKSAVKLKTGDILWSLKTSSANVVFEDGSIFRLSGNTKFVIQDLSKDEANLEVKNGSVWARILKPIGSGTTYNVETKSVSASVRGTSVSFKHDEESGLVGIKVIDSINDDEAILLKTKKDDKEIKIPKETSVVIDENKDFTQTKKLNIKKELEENPEIKENTKKDLLYMNELISSTIKEKVNSNNSNNTSEENDEEEIFTPKINIDLKKVSGEISQSIPEDEEEAEALFDNKEIADAFVKEQKKIENLVDNMEEQILSDTLEGLNKVNNLLVKDEVISEMRELYSDNEETSSQEKLDKMINLVVENDLSDEKVKDIKENDSLNMGEVFETYKDIASENGNDYLIAQFDDTMDMYGELIKMEQERITEYGQQIENNLKEQIKNTMEYNDEYVNYLNQDTKEKEDKIIELKNKLKILEKKLAIAKYELAKANAEKKGDDEYDEALYELEYRVEELEDEIKYTKEDIEDLQENIKDNKKDILEEQKEELEDIEELKKDYEEEVKELKEDAEDSIKDVKIDMKEDMEDLKEDMQEEIEDKKEEEKEAEETRLEAEKEAKEARLEAEKEAEEKIEEALEIGRLNIKNDEDESSTTLPEIDGVKVEGNKQETKKSSIKDRYKEARKRIKEAKKRIEEARKKYEK
ncbi:MAG: FecR domain-containing protein [Candidatus Gracilibacteria bacterium]|nr:FecR domain-containing protein [Candidatus Gracilibacteria bacterium]